LDATRGGYEGKNLQDGSDGKGPDNLVQDRLI
jgi:hypothetical protein